MQTRILNAVDLQRLVACVGIDRLMDEMVGALLQAFRSYDPQQSVTPQRTGFNYTQPTGLVEWMPIHCVGDNVLMKLVGYHPESPLRHGSPTIVSTISTYDTSTGHLEFLMDGTFATAMRTGAASALASQLLAKPDSRVLGLVGCGAQAITQLHAIQRVFDLEQVLIYDTDDSITANFAARTAAFANNVPVHSASLNELAAESDILCTATSVEVGEGAVINLHGAKPHLHVNAVGSDFPGKTELDLQFLEHSIVCPDFLPQAVVEGECQRLREEQIGPTIVDIAKAPDRNEDYQQRSTVFDSTGWALEDWVATQIIRRHAMEQSVGQNVGVEYLPSDPRNPYEFLLPTSVPVR